MAEQENKISNIDLDENKGDNTAGPPSVNGVNELSEERRLEIETEVAKLQDEINTLKQALMRKERQVTELRTELGETRWSRLQKSPAVNKSKQALSDAGQKTSQALKSFGAATATKWHELKESPRVQSASEKFWSATTAVKTKIYGDSQKSTAADPPTAQIVQPVIEEQPK